MTATLDRRRAHVTLPVELIAEIDSLVGSRGRSRFLEEAAAEKLQVIRRVAAFERALAVPTVGVPEWYTSESAAAWVRELREEWGERQEQALASDAR